MISRRTVVQLGFLAAAGAVRPVAYFRPPAENVVQLENVWLGIGPFLASELRPGLLLRTQARAGRHAVVFDGNFVGWLPAAMASAPASVRVARAAFDRAGRFGISVTA